MLIGQFIAVLVNNYFGAGVNMDITGSAIVYIIAIPFLMKFLKVKL